MSDERVVKLQAIERWTLGLGAVFVLVSFAFGRQIGLSVSFGVALMSANAIAIRFVGERLFRAATSQAGVSPLRAVVLLNVKLLALAAAIWLVMRHLHVDPIAFLVGLSVYPLAICAFALTHVPPSASETTIDTIGDPNG